jgi:hypothetical protein
LAATVLDFAGAPSRGTPPQAPSLRPVMAGGANPTDTGVFFEVDFVPLQAEGTEKVANKRGGLIGRLKVIRDLLSGAVEVYDLAEDPGETHNLWHREPERARAALAQLSAMERRLTSDPVAPASSGPEFTEAELERLESLGYVDRQPNGSAR